MFPQPQQNFRTTDIRHTEVQNHQFKASHGSNLNGLGPVHSQGHLKAESLELTRHKNTHQLFVIHHQGLTGEQARNVLDQLAQTMDGPSILNACRELDVEADPSVSRQLLGTKVWPSVAPLTPSGNGGTP